MALVHMHNPKEPAGHQDVFCRLDRVDHFKALGWTEKVEAKPAEGAAEKAEAKPADARRKPRKTAEQD